MARYFIDTDAHGDLALWRDNNNDFPTPVLYRRCVTGDDTWDLIVAAVTQ